MISTKKPIIGMTPLVERATNRQFMLNTYTESVLDAGGVPVMLPITDEDKNIEHIAEMCDGFLFTGGHDVHPCLYGEEMLDCVAPCEERDSFETKLLSLALKTNKPILAICRGMQLLNVVLGGSLFQDIQTQCSNDIEHRMGEPSDNVIHEISIIDDTPLMAIVGKKSDMINSYHHQCVKTVGEGLKIMAYASDGIIEGMYMPDKKFVLGVQWHPERLAKKYDSALSLFKVFIENCVEGEE